MLQPHRGHFKIWWGDILRTSFGTWLPWHCRSILGVLVGAQPMNACQIGIRELGAAIFLESFQRYVFGVAEHLLLLELGQLWPWEDVLGLQQCSDDCYMSSNTHTNARSQNFPVELCIIMRWYLGKIFPSLVSGLNVVESNLIVRPGFKGRREPGCSCRSTNRHREFCEKFFDLTAISVSLIIHVRTPTLEDSQSLFTRKWGVLGEHLFMCEVCVLHAKLVCV